MEVRHYVTPDGVDLLQAWLDNVKDDVTRVVIVRRLDRLVTGNLGDHRFCGDGVWELRIDYGPGFRVYYARAATSIVLLLCGGAKRTQAKDIREAKKRWADFKQRQHDT